MSTQAPSAQHTEGMETQAELLAPCSMDELFAWVAELDRYPEWLEIVPAARRVGDDAWEVDLRGTLGPVARTKRLRMVRTTFDPPHRVVFDRAEVDERDHSPWRLSVALEAVPEGTFLQMDLAYGGGLFGPVIERALRDAIERARPRLLALVAPAAS